MTEEAKWNAVINNDTRYDDVFFYAVHTTGVFCRPSCRSKAPSRKNIRFFDTAQTAQQAGFRPCKRCRPDLPCYNPAQDIATRIHRMVDHSFAQRQSLCGEIMQLGISMRRANAIFKSQYGLSIQAYANMLRIQRAERLLTTTDDTVASVAYGVGFESASSFYRQFHRHTGLSPTAYRATHKKEH